MKKYLLILLFIAFEALAKGGGYSAPSRSSPSRSYSAPSRSAPSRSYTAPPRSQVKPNYTAPARTPVPSTPRYSPRYAPQQTVIVQQGSSGFGLMHYLMFWQLFRHSDNGCTGGGCSRQNCGQVQQP